MAREKNHDEIYCRSCGEPIKKKAEICPECGVRNDYAPRQTAGQPSADAGGARAGQPGQSRRQTQTTASGQTQRPQQSRPQSRSDTPHDPTQHTTTASDNWHYAVGASGLLWVLAFLIPDGIGLGGLSGLLILAAWVLMPLSIYYDTDYLRATSEWDAETALWILGACVPVANVGVAALYLLRRHNLTEVSPAQAGVDTAHSESTEDDALQTLRERYSRGEIDDAEFERRLEQIVGTEDRATAEAHARDVAETQAEVETEHNS